MPVLATCSWTKGSGCLCVAGFHIVTPPFLPPCQNRIIYKTVAVFTLPPSQVSSLHLIAMLVIPSFPSHRNRLYGPTPSPGPGLRSAPRVGLLVDRKTSLFSNVSGPVVVPAVQRPVIAWAHPHRGTSFARELPSLVFFPSRGRPYWPYVANSPASSLSSILLQRPS